MLAARGRLVTNGLLGMRLASTYSSLKMLRKYPVGAKVHGFEIEKVLPVPEFKMTAVGLTHERTNAKHLHIDRDDSNNVFSIAFKTNPPDSTGVAHILEHTTLCGSEQYPVRDPFFKMLNRSLSNFMNAMTGHDYTFFPFATTNKADYSNLTDVYLDATLQPLLSELDFQQEGWRLENEITEDKLSPLIFKGVVYNEMKGQVSNSSYYYWIKFQESIYPSLNNSGGDPTKITDLQYWDLIDFHQTNYHPSNSRIFTYGSFPLVSTLEKLDKKFIVFGKRGVKNVIKEPIPLYESESVTVEGPIDPMLLEDKQIKSSVTWFVGDPKDSYQTFLWKILSTLLMDGHSAPLYQALIESGIGSDFTVNSGMDSMTKVNMLTVGLQGLDEQNSQHLSSLINDILAKTVTEGFEGKRIDAILHQLELGKKLESAEFGMNLLSSLTPMWVNDVDPFELLSFDATLDKFRAEYKERGSALFTDLIKDHLLNKPHFCFTMKPSLQFQENLEIEEKRRLANKTKDLNDEEKQILYDRGLQLQAKQNEAEDPSCLPTLHVEDIPTRGDFIPIDVSNGDVPVYKRESPKANGLTYFRAIKDITSVVPVELIPYIPLFTECLTNLGTKTKDMSELGEEIKLATGGLSASVNCSCSPFDISKPNLKFFLSGVALNQNVTKLFDLFKQILIETNFENTEKLSILIKSLNSDNLNEIISSGHSFAKSYGTSLFSEKAAYDELLSGVKQVQFLSQLDKWNDEHLLEEKVIPNLLKLQKILVSNDNFNIALTCDKEVMLTHETLATDLISLLPNYESTKTVSPILIPSGSTDFKSFIKIPTQVQFSSLSLPGVSYNEKDSASLQVLSQLLTFKKLHKEIREKGGAYGGGAGYDALSGIFNFYSYRDPNPFNSLKQFENAGKYIDENIIDFGGSIAAETVSDAQVSAESIVDKDLEQAKLSIFQRVDAPIAVRDEGMTFFMNGIDDNMRQERRLNLLDVTLSDIQEVSEKYMINPTCQSSCIIGSDTTDLSSDWKVFSLGEEAN